MHQSPICDLIARTIALALTGKEDVPPRPQQLDVPIHDAGKWLGWSVTVLAGMFAFTLLVAKIPTDRKNTS